MNAEQVSDQVLIRKYLNGDESSLEHLIKKYQKNIFTVIYMLVRDKNLADDLFQETFIKIINTLRAGKYFDEGKFLPWAARIARNLCIDYMRKQKRDLTITDTEGNDIFSYLVIVDESSEVANSLIEIEHDLRKLICILPEEQRQVLVLRHWGNLSFKEISEITGVSINTALGRMRYAIQNIKKLMGSRGMRLTNFK
jgi:RNA polymerase sigma factor (sigma-70 family)